MVTRWLSFWSEMMRVLAMGACALATVLVAMPVGADAQNRKTRERLEEIERQLSDLQGAVFGADDAGAPVRFEGANPTPEQRAAAATGEGGAGVPVEVSLRISGLEQEVQRLTAEMERMSYAMQQQNQRMDRLVQLIYPDLQDQQNLGLVAQRDLLGPASGAVTGDPLGQPSTNTTPVDLLGTEAPATSLPGFSTAEAAYSAGRSALFAGRFEDAERAFLALTEGYPESEQYADGLYYLGEVYLAQGELRASAEAYLDFIRNHGDHPNAARAHLKLGEAFARAERTKEACRVWLRGVQTYPNMDEELMLQIQDLRVQTECPGAVLAE